VGVSDLDPTQDTDVICVIYCCLPLCLSLFNPNFGILSCDSPPSADEKRLWFENRGEVISVTERILEILTETF
jgi:hypothetical protein